MVTIAFAAFLAWKVSRCRRRKQLGDRIFSFSPDMRDATPYPFDAKSPNDLESRYPSRPPRINLNDPQVSTSAFGVASTLPSGLTRPATSIDEQYNLMTRGQHSHVERPDTFTCAMYPAGSCPLEYEREREDQVTLGINRVGSPVPSFHTGRMDAAIVDPQVRPSGKLLTPPQPRPRYKSKHVPPPLLITPSFREGSNSVRGFTPRRSNTVSTVSSSSVYTAM